MMNIENILDEQFVLVSISDGTTAQQMMMELVGIYPVLAEVGWILTASDVYFNVADGIKYGFSLNTLRHHLGERASVSMYQPGMDG